jgi:hypothetical protein
MGTCAANHKGKSAAAAAAKYFKNGFMPRKVGPLKKNVVA